MSNSKKMWDGRFESGMAQSMIDLSFSLAFDQELIEEDIQGSIAHGKGLVESGVLTEEEYSQIVSGLQGILADYKNGVALWNDGDEDVHMAVERVLTERIGQLGKKFILAEAETTKSAPILNFICAIAPKKFLF